MEFDKHSFKQPDIPTPDVFKDDVLIESSRSPDGYNARFIMEWVRLTDRLPVFDANLRVLIHTAGHDFNGEQFFDVRATDLYDGPDGEPQSEVCAVATHWTERPRLAL